MHSSKKKHNTMKDTLQAFHKLEFPINFLKKNKKWMNENK
jgi:hypothetical protein